MNIWATPERNQLRKTVRAFAEREILPHVDEWERIGELPRELHRRAGQAGLLGANFPEAVGGGGGDGADAVIVCEELHEAGRLEGLKRAPKLDALVGTEDKPGLIREILEAHPENKIVVFSFFKDMLDIVAERTRSLTKSVLFTGAVSITNRDKAKQTFATDPDTRLFLSSDAGGIGLDLPVANYLISYDLPWSSGAFAQRQSRIIRLSSKFPQVTLLTIQVAGSIEEYQHALLAQKKKVAEAVVDGKGINTRGNLTLDLRSLTDFLGTSQI